MATVTQTAPVVVSVNKYGYKIDGQFYRRVTTVLKMLPKEALVYWAAREVAEFAFEFRESWEGLPKKAAEDVLKKAPWRHRDGRADRGTAIHRAIHAYVENRPLPELDEDTLDAAIAAESFMRDFGIKPKAAELTVFSRSLGVAGTLDLWGPVGIDNWIVDFKTGKDVYPDQALQLACYGSFEYAILDGKVVDWGPARAQHIAVVHIHERYPNGYGVYEVLPDRERLYRVFRALAWLKTEWKDPFDSRFGKGAKEQMFGEPFTGTNGGSA